MERKKIHRVISKVINNENIAPAVKHLTISIPKDFDFYPGQFISMILNKDGREIKRPYSIASKSGLPYIELCIKILQNGLGTPIIGKMKKEDEVDILGPMGDFIIKDFSKDLVFISTGTGIGPFRSMIFHLLENDNENKENNFKNKIILLTGYRYEEDILYDKEFKNLQEKHKNFFYETILSKTTPEEDKQKEKNENNYNNNKENGYVQNLVKNYLDNSGNKHYYICGLKEMVNSVKDLLLTNNIPKENIFFEKYD